MGISLSWHTSYIVTIHFNTKQYGNTIWKVFGQVKLGKEHGNIVPVDYQLFSWALQGGEQEESVGI